MVVVGPRGPTLCIINEFSGKDTIVEWYLNALTCTSGLKPFQMEEDKDSYKIIRQGIFKCSVVWYEMSTSTSVQVVIGVYLRDFASLFVCVWVCAYQLLCCPIRGR